MSRLMRYMINYQGNKIVKAYCTLSKYKLYSLSPVVIERIDIGFSYKCQIRFSNKRSGVKYIYTLDGSEPTLSNGTVIENDTIELVSNCTIKAIAIIESLHVIEISASVSSMSISDLKLPLVSFGLDKYDGFEIKNILSTSNQSQTVSYGSGITQYANCLRSGIFGQSQYTDEKRYYCRFKYKMSRNFENGESYTNLAVHPENDYCYEAPRITNKYQILSYMSRVTTSSFGYILNKLTLQSDIILYFTEGMCIDIYELEEAYPYFAELSINEQKEILDTLPFFQDRFEL